MESRACVLHSEKDLRIESVPVADMADDQVLVRIGAGGICGSDLHYYLDGGFGVVRVKQPIVLGHEVAGTVEAVGAKVTKVKPGDRITTREVSEALGISEMKIEGLIKEFGEKAVNEKLVVLKQRLENDGLKKVENSFAYLRSLLRSPGGDDEITKPRTSADANAIPHVDRVLQSAKAEPQALSPSQVQNKAFDEWIADRRRFVTDEIQKLDSFQKEQLFKAVAHELTEKGLMTPVLKRRAAQGDMMHGALGVHCVNHYAKVLLGPDWNKPDADLFGVVSK